MPQKQSLLLITVDCFRADHAGFLGYSRPTTPFLDSLAWPKPDFFERDCGRRSDLFLFSRHDEFAISAQPWARDVVGLAPDEPTLASSLKRAGSATAAFLAANPYLSPRFGYDAGFDTFRDFLDAKVEPLSSAAQGDTSLTRSGRLNLKLAKLSHQLGPVGSLYDELYFQYRQRLRGSNDLSFDQMRRFPSADVIVKHALDWVNQLASQPFFLWLHLMDPHSPYYPPQPALDLMGTRSISSARARYLNSYWNRGDLGRDDAARRRLERHRDDIVTLYDAGIRWMDTQVARLVVLGCEARVCGMAV